LTSFQSSALVRESVESETADDVVADVTLLMILSDMDSRPTPLPASDRLSACACSSIDSGTDDTADDDRAGEGEPLGIDPEESTQLCVTDADADAKESDI